MSLSPAEVQRIAKLARIALPDTELPVMQQQLDRILGLIETLRAVNTEGVAPMAHAQDLSQRLRPDQVSAGNVRAACQAIAPAVEAGLYLVPQVIE